jgi:hypothetical protein
MIRALAILLLLLQGAAASAQCRQALALGLDVSGSVDDREYRLQLDGLARALAAPEIAERLLAPPGHVMLAVYEWSEPENQHVILPWTAIDSAAALSGASARLAATQRRDTPPGTALGTAMQTGARLLGARPECWKRTLDLSGDGKRNIGPLPQAVKAGLPDWLTINALTVGEDNPAVGDTRQAEIGELSSYFRAYVISGADAFVETALGFESFEAAMIRKLLRELDTLVLSAR